MNNYKHETGLSPVKPFDRLQPTTRQFTGTPRVHRAYVLNRTTGKVVDACGHKHRSTGAAKECADKMMADVMKRATAPQAAPSLTLGEQAIRDSGGIPG